VAPHQLRHARATEVRARYDLETARALLGHGTAAVTEGYAERDLGMVRKIMAEIG
jgi:site-specific recombinase XerD